MALLCISSHTTVDSRGAKTADFLTQSPVTESAIVTSADATESSASQTIPHSASSDSPVDANNMQLDDDTGLDSSSSPLANFGPYSDVNSTAPASNTMQTENMQTENMQTENMQTDEDSKGSENAEPSPMRID